MSLTAEQKRDVSRQNGRKSKGPSEQGRLRSRYNALKHGLRAETLVLPDEDPAMIAARASAWGEYYQPESPAAIHLTDQCVRATLLADRCDRFQAAALSRQMREAEERWDRDQEDRLERIKTLMREDPGAALVELQRLVMGLRWLIV